MATYWPFLFGGLLAEFLIGLFAIFAVFILFFLIGWGLICSCKFGLEHPRQIFKGCVSNKEFKIMMWEIFKNANYDGYRVSGNGYAAWVANGYFGFNINEIKDFSLYQRILFFKTWNKLLKQALKEQAQEKLQIDKLKMLATKNGQLLYGQE